MDCFVLRFAMTRFPFLGMRNTNPNDADWLARSQ